MSHDIPSHMCAIIAFLRVATGRGARIKALACIFIGGRSMAARVSMARLGVYFALNCSWPSYDLTMDEEANDYICVLAKAQDPCR